MKDFSVLMALCDFLPVGLFGSAAVMLQRDLYNKMSKGAFALFGAGTIDVTVAGFLKALYKLLYAAGVCDFVPLSEMFFPVQAIGFLLAGIGIVAMLCHRQSADGMLPAAVAPAVFTGTFLFVSFMVAGLAGITVGLSAIAAKLKKKTAIVFFLLSLIFSMGMGYLSSKDFSGSLMNWIAEGVNIVGQASLLIGAAMLRAAGLKELRLEENN